MTTSDYKYTRQVIEKVGFEEKKQNKGKLREETIGLLTIKLHRTLDC